MPCRRCSRMPISRRRSTSGAGTVMIILPPGLSTAVAVSNHFWRVSSGTCSMTASIVIASNLSAGLRASGNLPRLNSYGPAGQLLGSSGSIPIPDLTREPACRNSAPSAQPTSSTWAPSGIHRSASATRLRCKKRSTPFTSETRGRPCPENSPAARVLWESHRQMMRPYPCPSSTASRCRVGRPKSPCRLAGSSSPLETAENAEGGDGPSDDDQALRERRQSEVAQCRVGLVPQPENEEEHIESQSQYRHGDSHPETTVGKTRFTDKGESMSHAGWCDRRGVGQHGAGQHRLHAKNQCNSRKEHGLPNVRADLHSGRMEERDAEHHGTQDEQGHARTDQQQVGSQHENEQKVAPSIGPRCQLRLTDTGPVAGLDLLDAETGAGGVDQHLAGELHAG